MNDSNKKLNFFGDYVSISGAYTILVISAVISILEIIAGFNQSEMLNNLISRFFCMTGMYFGWNLFLFIITKSVIKNDRR